MPASVVASRVRCSSKLFLPQVKLACHVRERPTPAGCVVPLQDEQMVEQRCDLRDQFAEQGGSTDPSTATQTEVETNQQA